MPNWCNNTITLTGPKEKISAIYAKAVEDNALLQQLKPMPEALEDTTSPAPKEGKVQPLVDGFDNWYDWRVQNWGTKWDVDVDNLELSEDGTTITGWFDSAWAPPIHAYEYFLTDNEDCSIKSYYYAQAQFNLGFMYDQGAGVAQSDVEAVRWYRKTADQGHAQAR